MYVGERAPEMVATANVVLQVVIAVIVHLHTGDPPPMIFLVYAAAIWVVLQDADASRSRPA